MTQRVLLRIEKTFLMKQILAMLINIPLSPSTPFLVYSPRSLHRLRCSWWQRSSALVLCNKEMRQTLIHCKEREEKIINETSTEKSCKISRDKLTDTNNWQRLLQH